MSSGATDTAAGFLSGMAGAPLLPPEAVRAWGKTLVVAPHPDDESLGCGGAIALLSRFGLPIYVLFVSDGTGSHPNSLKYPAPVLRELRESEAKEALNALGVPASCTAFLRLPDGAVPSSGSGGFDKAVALCAAYLAEALPETILLPWRRDPHPDHRATSQILQAALSRQTPAPRLLEYPVWAWERAVLEDIPHAHEASAFRLDIGEIAGVKRSAIDAHRSQVTRMIDDDPQGFWLSPEVIAHFERPWEVYLETLSW